MNIDTNLIVEYFKNLNKEIDNFYDIIIELIKFKNDNNINSKKSY